MDGILVCGFEVTAQVRAAQELAGLLAATEASERQFRELVENLPELAWTARPDGFIDYYNRRWYEYTGTTFEAMQGWGWKAIHDPAKLEAVLERWQHSIDAGMTLRSSLAATLSSPSAFLTAEASRAARHANSGQVCTCAERVLVQLRGDGGPRQVPDARVAVVSSGGLTPSGVLLLRADA